MEYNFNFLAPLDFDLAFTRDSFQPDGCSDAKRIDELWQELRRMESQAMLLALGGFSINSGVEGRAEVASPYEPIRIALRDTIVLGFDAGYGGNADSHPISEETAPLLRSLIRLALISSDSVIA